MPWMFHRRKLESGIFFFFSPVVADWVDDGQSHHRARSLAVCRPSSASLLRRGEHVALVRRSGVAGVLTNLGSKLRL